MSEQNKKTIRIVRQEAPTNLAVLDGLYTDDYVYHGIPLLGDLKGPDAFTAMYAGFMRSHFLGPQANEGRSRLRSISWRFDPTSLRVPEP